MQLFVSYVIWKVSVCLVKALILLTIGQTGLENTEHRLLPASFMQMTICPKGVHLAWSIHIQIVGSCLHFGDDCLGLKAFKWKRQEDQGDSVARSGVSLYFTLCISIKSGMHLLLTDLSLRIWCFVLIWCLWIGYAIAICVNIPGQ